MTEKTKALNNPRTYIRLPEPVKLTKAEQKKAGAEARRAWKLTNVVGGRA